MNRSQINRIFGSEMAQNDKRFLEYCIYRNDILDVIADDKEDFLILNAPRGSGKSGLFIQLNQKLEKYEGILSIPKSRDDADYPFKKNISIQETTNFWKNQLLGWIFTEIGSKKNFAFSEENINAVEFAELKGEKPKNIISLVLGKLKFNGLPLEKCNIDPTVREAEVLRLLKSSVNTFWLILDEIDDNYDGSKMSNNMLAGLLLASQTISKKAPNVKIRVSIRPHIMRVLETNFDSIQKLRELQINITWSDGDLRRLLAERIRNYLAFLDDVNAAEALREIKSIENQHERDNAMISTIFDNFSNSGERRGNFRTTETLLMFSMRRPRLLIEYCKMCAEQHKKGKISFQNSRNALHDFGANRITHLEGEHNPIFPSTGAILNQFSALNSYEIGGYQKLRDFIQHNIIRTGIVELQGISSSVKTLEIARFLFMVDFIQAREDYGEYHKILYYIDRPQLLATWKNAKELKWQVHPSFSYALDIVETETYRTGGKSKLAKRTKDWH